jgi:hypothetical protein
MPTCPAISTFQNLGPDYGISSAIGSMGSASDASPFPVQQVRRDQEENSGEVRSQAIEKMKEKV